MQLFCQHSNCFFFLLGSPIPHSNFQSVAIFRNTDGKDPSPVDVVVYPRIYRGLYIPGGAGFLPTVSHEIQDAGSSPPG